MQISGMHFLYFIVTSRNFLIDFAQITLDDLKKE